MGLLLQGFRFGMTFYFPLALGSKAGIDDIPTLLKVGNPVSMTRYHPSEFQACQVRHC